MSCHAVGGGGRGGPCLPLLHPPALAGSASLAMTTENTMMSTNDSPGWSTRAVSFQAGQVRVGTYIYARLSKRGDYFC